MKLSKIITQEPVEVEYKPIFDIPENIVLGIGDKKIGEKVKLLVNFEIIEKTKNYTILRSNGIIILKTKRIF